MPHGETLQVPLDRPAAKAPFRLVLPWDLAGDQPAATVGLQKALAAGERQVTFRGGTRSGETPTMAKGIAHAGRATPPPPPNKKHPPQPPREVQEVFPRDALQYLLS